MTVDLWIADRFRDHVGRYANQISGALLVLADVLLGMREVRES